MRSVCEEKLSLTSNTTLTAVHVTATGVINEKKFEILTYRTFEAFFGLLLLFVFWGLEMKVQSVSQQLGPKRHISKYICWITVEVCDNIHVGVRPAMCASPVTWTLHHPSRTSAPQIMSLFKRHFKWVRNGSLSELRLEFDHWDTFPILCRLFYKPVKFSVGSYYYLNYFRQRK